jgi:hypothetical protein
MKFLPLLTRIYKHQEFIKYDCIQYIMNNAIQQYITTDIQYIIILCGNPNGKKPHNSFFIYKKITFIGSTEFQNSPTPTRRHQPHIYKIQLEGSYNSLDFPVPTGRRLQPKGSYNYLYSPTLNGRRLQPPFIAP